MTVSSTTNKISYSGNGSTVEFTTPYFTANSDIVATLEDSSGTETTLAITTHYTLSGAGTPGGGTLTMVTAPTTGETLSIKTDPSIVQNVDYIENDAFPAATHEGALDKLTLICQSLSEKLGRAITFKISSTATGVNVPDPEGDKIIGWDSSGVRLENKTLVGSGTISVPVSILNGGTGATSASGARANLGLGDLAVEDSVSIALGGTGASTASGARANLDLEPGVDVEPYDADILKADQPDTLEAGYSSQTYDAGTKTSGTFTPLASNGNFQKYVNGGAHTLAPPGTDTSIVLKCTNNSNAGGVTTSSFTVSDGDSMTSNSGYAYILYITRIDGDSHLSIKALQ